jgi:hypothetical protein
MPSLTFQPKGAASSDHPVTGSHIPGSEMPTMPAIDRPLKIIVVYDDRASGHSANALIKRVASDFDHSVESFAFDELGSPGARITAAWNASDTDILVVSVRDDQDLPGYMRFWLGLYLGLRINDKEGLLVMLMAKTATSLNPDPSVSGYLKTVAAIGEMGFLCSSDVLIRPGSGILRRPC